MDTIRILKAIKTELKKAKITYRDLAKELKISEAGVKKIFSRRDLSLERAFEICKVLNFPFAEIISLSENSQQGELRFTDKQVDYLKKNIHFFHFYMKLAYEQKTPLQIQAEHRLSYRMLNTYLKKLEELGLVKRHPRDRAQIVGGTPLTVSTGGTALESVKFDITKQLLAQIESSKEGAISGAGLYLVENEKEELKTKLIELMNSYSIISSRNRRSPKTRATPLSVMILQSPSSMFNKIDEI